MFSNLKKILIFQLFFLSVFYLFAREVTIIVKDADLDLPLEGAIIRTRGGNEFRCNRDGIAVLQLPDNRQTVLYALYPGYETGVITIPLTGETFTVSLNLAGYIQGKELIVEASMPGTSESRTGRSVAVSAREISQSGEIGIIEDVMNTIKLLPGVNYSGTFNAVPSIRGGHPGEMITSFDGFYINNPFHWGGGFSIFDPRMVQNAQLSHGVFSSRYGHTISGLLEISSKDPSTTETMLELVLNTSTANLNLSFPFQNKGGILFMGRLTFYDPVIKVLKELSNTFPAFEDVNIINRSPYIRSTAISGNYRFTENLEIASTAFFGMDGMGAYYLNSSQTDSLKSDTEIEADTLNYQGFFTASLSYNPRKNKLLKFIIGTGYEDIILEGDIKFDITEKYFTEKFLASNLPDLAGFLSNPYSFKESIQIDQSELLYNFQGRIDYDWQVSDRFIFSAGVQEMYNIYKTSGNFNVSNDIRLDFLPDIEQEQIKDMFSLPFLPNPIPKDSDVWNDMRINMPIEFSLNSENNLFTTSAYMLGDFSSPKNKIKAELGIRVDHFLIQGEGFSVSSDPVLNPRLNFDINIIRNAGILQSFDISAGTGLFSSINDAVFLAEERYGIDKIKPNRSWTSILGLKMQFPNSLIFNIEGYYKYVFDRMYIPIGIGLEDIDIKPLFDGEGIIWGTDIMLQKIQSRYWDGWLSYSYNWTNYHDPGSNSSSMSMGAGDVDESWYFPSFHRFHNLNLVFNIKPIQRINIYVRFSIASGVLLSRRTEDEPQSYPVLIFNRDNPLDSYFIEKFYWPSVYDENNRSNPSLPMDIKFSFFGGNSKGKTRYELYFALENALAPIYRARGNYSHNQYTGEIDRGSDTAVFDIPIPIPSFGFKLSY